MLGFRIISKLFLLGYIWIIELYFSSSVNWLYGFKNICFFCELLKKDV